MTDNTLHRTAGPWQRFSSLAQFLASLLITIVVLCYLLFVPSAPPVVESTLPRHQDPVRIEGPGLLYVDPESPITKKLQIVAVRKAIISSPVLTVTGRVAASLRPGRGKGEDFWQFDSADVLTTYTDWRKAQADIAFAEQQLASVKQLAAARLDAQQKVVARLEKLVAAGTDTPKDLALEKANLIQVEISGRKDVYEAETSVRVAKRAEAAAAKQLQQTGLDPDLLRSTSADTDLLMADVPEGRLNRVKVGQSCRAGFFGLTGERFTGTVASIAPVLSKDRRSLRALLIVNDPNDELRPGMFAEVGLGTDPRETLLVPADSVLHVSRADYVLVAAQPHTWHVTEVQVGEPRTDEVEILSGLTAGQQIIGKGAILFKPVIVQALQLMPTSKSENAP
jgi:membrane fusion protein, heavy metal efflux system